jgi:hypothetical protein
MRFILLARARRSLGVAMLIGIAACDSGATAPSALTVLVDSARILTSTPQVFRVVVTVTNSSSTSVSTGRCADPLFKLEARNNDSWSEVASNAVTNAAGCSVNSEFGAASSRRITVDFVRSDQGAFVSAADYRLSLRVPSESALSSTFVPMP